jgi:hypothetical protein
MFVLDVGSRVIIGYTCLGLVLIGGSCSGERGGFAWALGTSYFISECRFPSLAEGLLYHQ